ncbi:ornithine cyclodeaminase family protein [Nocardioides insulae]|uniref:ornithine cyclodeaminase family protein n=1 Tax=Nocardioides insulae TaxID=394734 RepID=UPI00041F64B4|nr:ornithine cyclodeaminase family protein [Nocardioides insulae]
METLPFLTGSDLAAAVSGAEAVRALEAALQSGEVDPEQDSPRLFSPAPGGEFLLMPTEGGTWSGVKALTVAPDNPGRGKPKIQGIYALIRSDDLAPVVLMDGVELTLIRTPATTVLAVEHLLGLGPVAPSPLPVVVFGTGPQADRHLAYLREVLGPLDVTVVGRRAAPAEALAQRWSERGIPTRVGDAEAVRDAALVVCVTSSSEPLFDADLVPDDAVIAAVGAHGPDIGELPPELVLRSDLVVEGRASAMRESGNLLRARPAAEWAGDRAPANLADLVTGRMARTPGRPAVYTGVGMAWEDLVVATAAAQRHGVLEAGVR